MVFGFIKIYSYESIYRKPFLWNYLYVISFSDFMMNQSIYMTIVWPGTRQSRMKHWFLGSKLFEKKYIDINPLIYKIYVLIFVKKKLLKFLLNHPGLPWVDIKAQCILAHIDHMHRWLTYVWIMIQGLNMASIIESHISNNFYILNERTWKLPTIFTNSV